MSKKGLKTPIPSEITSPAKGAPLEIKRPHMIDIIQSAETAN